MLSKLSNLIARCYSLRLMISLCIAVAFFFWLFNFSSLPLSNPALMRVSHGKELLDVRLYYSAQEAFQAMKDYGPEGREIYQHFLVADFVFAPLYGLAFSLLLTLLARALFGPASSWSRLNLLPIGIALIDWLENTCLFLLLIRYPGQNVFIGTASGIATLAKWVLTAVTLAVFAFMGMRLLAKRLAPGRT
jgi:hypothetical protein